MAVDYRTIAHEGYSEITEKKSRFLGEAVRAATLEEAEAYIAAVRKRHYDARHHCFAFCVGEPGTPDEIWRSSDDGEPSGTAGKPMLEILKGRELHRTLLVVTRYFGGTLLGTGGLVRAYSAAAKEAADSAGIVLVRQGIRLLIGCTYPALGRFQYLFAREGITIADTKYGENVTLEVIVPESDASRVREMVTRTTDGTGTCTEAGRMTYEDPGAVDG